MALLDSFESTQFEIITDTLQKEYSDLESISQDGTLTNNHCSSSQKVLKHDEVKLKSILKGGTTDAVLKSAIPIFFKDSSSSSKKTLRFADDCGGTLGKVYLVAKVNYYTWWEWIMDDDLCSVM
mmetsp:Transcript_2829/g.4754  ORF Transcript_2829/g.4754 Transcript_2829/m.4754 type:complete len:124 (-) Transcript_2829:354-725(-)